jgi:hypothetical protein
MPVGGNGASGLMTTIVCPMSSARQLSSLVERLARVIRPTYIPTWLNKPNPALDGDKPIDRIAQGDYRSVARLISGLEDPGAS